MANLPNELCLQIIAHNYYLPSGGVDYYTISAFALVHSSWLDPCRRLLFHSIRFDKGHCLLQIADSQHLASCVRRLSVPIQLDPKNGRGLDPARFALVLSRCTGLYELTIQSSGFHQWEQEGLSELRMMTDSLRIRALRMPSFGVQSPIIYQLTSIWPEIQFLTIGAEIGAAPPAGLEKPQLKLKELVLGRISPEYLQWFLPSPEQSATPALKLLELRDAMGESLLNVTAPHCPHIRSLRIMHFNRAAAALLHMCTHLEELVLYHVPIIFPLENLPSTIEHFSIRNPANTAIDIQSAIVAPIEALPSLRVVTIDEQLQQHPGLAALQNVCDTKGVEMRVHTASWFIPEDPIIPRHFPRCRSVSNLHLMN
ncbi:hypothetical protein FIBSPDRAFT_811063 [Athelia psychrophila]|uniref:F-box domain-containing protein n=1 Tax=Athelia psychrophila TaxID=1759441 RepID=A0A166WE97_9AGAM|nr:hypothetical protein FIBSPDRAFT_811063 [Fibularhizoctonia sp. CBS 109695]